MNKEKCLECGEIIDWVEYKKCNTCGAVIHIDCIHDSSMYQECKKCHNGYYEYMEKN